MDQLDRGRFCFQPNTARTICKPFQLVGQGHDQILPARIAKIENGNAISPSGQRPGKRESGVQLKSLSLSPPVEAREIFEFKTRHRSTGKIKPRMMPRRAKAGYFVPATMSSPMARCSFERAVS